MSLGSGIGQTKADPSREINAGVLGKTSMVTPGVVFQPDEIALMRLALDDAETILPQATRTLLEIVDVQETHLREDRS